ncbi:MAG: methylated-DNA--[protein]-cysteine S-methyltransferase [Phycisphaerales bacterium]
MKILDEPVSVVQTRADSPVGMLRLAATDRGIAAAEFVGAFEQAPAASNAEPRDDTVALAANGTAPPAHGAMPATDTAIPPANSATGHERALGHLAQLERELAAYFAGTLPRGTFTVPLDLRGTTFQLETWHALCAIPFGTTISYSELARRIDRPTGQRAVGAANGANPIAIIVPCHRVVAADGSLHGYGGGLERKAWLVGHEREHAPGRRPGLFR